jgi:anti-anti-sigma factor
MKLTPRTEGDVLILALEGRFVLGEGETLVSETIRRALEGGARKILLNFEKVTTLDSAGLGELVGTLATVKKHGARLRLCELNSRIYNLMQMTALHTVFDLAEREAEALAAY